MISPTHHLGNIAENKGKVLDVSIPPGIYLEYDHHALQLASLVFKITALPPQV